MTEKPPLGLRPRFIVTEHRVVEIDEAIRRYADAGQEIPSAWTDERDELVAWLNRNTQHPLFPFQQATVEAFATMTNEERATAIGTPMKHGAHCKVCGHLVERADPHDPESYVHIEDGDWGDHTAEYEEPS